MSGSRGAGARMAVVGVAVVVCGASTLAMELAASRVLAPRFGSGIQVWGALLGVVMAALAAGYWLGGRLADRWPRTETFALTAFGGAVLVALVPVVDGPLGAAAESVTDHPGWGAALATLMLFLPPSVLLATAGPIAVRLREADTRRTGRASGDVLALSTVGSIAGSFAASFWLIQGIGVTRTFLLLALGLALSSAALLAVAGRVGAAAGAAATTLGVSALVLLPSGAALSRDSAPVRGADVLSDVEGPYHRVSVIRQGDMRVLVFGQMWQSAWVPGRPQEHQFEYSIAMQAGLAQAERRDAVLHIGLGGATIPRAIAGIRPGVRQEAVEIDPTVVDAAERWFGLRDIRGLEVHTDDGRRWLRRHPERRYDVILLDAYTSEGIPFHLFTQEYATLLRRHLAPGGAVAVNLHGAATGPGSRLQKAVHRTFASRFPHVTTFLLPAGRSDSVRNIVLVASERPVPSVAALEARFDAWRRGRGTGMDGLLASRVDRPDPAARLFTDDLAATDAVLDPALRDAALAQRPRGG